jgi:hypothetical protein
LKKKSETVNFGANEFKEFMKNKRQQQHIKTSSDFKVVPKGTMTIDDIDNAFIEGGYIFENLLFNNIPQFLTDTWHRDEINSITGLDRMETMTEISELFSFSDSVLRNNDSKSFYLSL